MKKIIKIAFIFAFIITIVGFFILFRSIDETLIEVLSKQFNILVKSYWVARLQKIGLISIIFGCSFLLIGYFLLNNWLFVKTIIVRMQKFYERIKTKLNKFIQFDTDKPLVEKRIKLQINLCDLGIAIGFFLIALL